MSAKTPQSSTLTADALLNLLLDRFEAPKARTRDITQPIDYTRVGGPSAQDEFHRVLQEAERAGGIVLEGARLGRFTGEFARVRLVDADKLYAFLVRTPAASVAGLARRKIGEAIPSILEDPFFAEIEREAIAAWGSNKSYLGLSPDQADIFITVIRLVHGIVHLAGRDVDHRTFSRRTVKDSKALERHEGRVARLLERRNVNLSGSESREILEASGIVRRAHLLQVKGPLRLVSNALMLEGTGDLFIGLPWAAAQQAMLMKPVDYVIAIENPTSFWRYCTEVGGCYLALLSDGFPARDVLSCMAHLVKVARSMADVPVYHWGDIDAGGVRIAAHLQEAFGIPIKLHEMQPSLTEEKGTPLQSRHGLQRLSDRADDVGELARWLCRDDAKALEQEELDPVAPSQLYQDGKAIRRRRY